MLRIFVDSGSSIKQEETEKYGVELIPLKILLGDEEFEDGVNLTMDKFYHELIVNKLFPKTSLPNLVKLEENIIKNNGFELTEIIEEPAGPTYTDAYAEYAYGWGQWDVAEKDDNTYMYIQLPFYYNEQFLHMHYHNLHYSLLNFYTLVHLEIIYMVNHHYF